MCGERNISKDLSDKLADLRLNDAWRGNSEMTWRRNNAMSCLDRIFTRLRNYKQTGITTNWALCDSDHVLVHAMYISGAKELKGPKLCRLDPSVVLDNNNLAILRNYLIEQLASLNENADPHLKLEFAKMTIRTKALELGKKMQNAEMMNLQISNDDIKLHERLLAESNSTEEETEILLHLEHQVIEKNKILDNQGKNLAWKAKTKWYNEGEKSNKYFLNLLRANSKKIEMDKINMNGKMITDPTVVNKVVNDFYSNLYNKNVCEIAGNDSFLEEMFKVQDNEDNYVSMPITLAELWAALKPLKDTAPGPDGISHIYLKKLWDIIGPLILEAWHYSLEIKKKQSRMKDHILGLFLNQIKIYRYSTIGDQLLYLTVITS